MIRQPVVAGQFYSGTQNALSRQVGPMIDKAAKKADAIGAVSPHAGYVYSGPVAGAVLSAMKPRSTYIIMGPNHTGLGMPFSISPSDSWKTPLGDVAVDKRLADQIKKNSRYIKDDELAHAHEHSIEVQLPFLQALQAKFRFVPIVIADASLSIFQAIGRELARSIKDLKMEKDIAVIASSDMTHYETREDAEKKDAKAIDAMLELDEEKLIDTVNKFNITMCGYAPTAVMLVTAKELGAAKARLVKYQTSGDVSGDYSAVVGYAGIVIE